MKVEETSSILAEHPYVKDEKMTKVLQRPTLVLNRNWQPVRAGELLAAPGTPELICPTDGALLFPKYPPRRPDGSYRVKANCRAIFNHMG